MIDIITELKSQFDSATVLTDDQDMAKYITDWPGTMTGRALAVVRPTNTTDVAAVMKLAFETATPVVPQSGNTSVAGGSVPDDSGTAIVLSLERMNKIRDVSPSAMTMTVEAGCVLETLHQTVEAQDLFFPLNFGAKGSCMIGGNLATNAGGQNVVRYGNTRELCLGIEAVMPDGRIVNLLSGLRKDNTGYDLRDLFIGSEGTLGIITVATMKLFHLPKARATTFAVVPDISRGLELLNRAQAETGGAVEAFELIPRVFLEMVQKYGPQHTIPFKEIPELCVLIEIAATSDAESIASEGGATPVSEKLEKILEAGFEDGSVLDAVIASSEAQRREMWDMREGALEIVTAAGARIGFDISLPLDQVHAFVDEMTRQSEAILPGLRMCHMGHLGDGNLHYSIYPPEGQADEMMAKADEIKAAVYAAIGDFGGSFSAEHGIGTSKLYAMTNYKDPVALAVMLQIKATLDPKGIMNPGKLLPQ
ncbi:MAG: FAD-binding oxidoreductase [Rhodospirillaceae bacterium]|jgi:FAD/FMN-containing dehydrogenase|nr:FAD-binding oxidoreductase [Rhodospirillaceae bacterium]MBT4939365.1 FAD-binding oxidoreductase [Rhodospirillaceae bacterium]MBT5940584.1 FAD-binding oxidoreductase [Rhodospirillaceae bacterium]MBT7267848.1 FAD-binding oxidoreductase [Rhodospirillaceae bacterium]